MKSWSRPGVPSLPGSGSVPFLWDTASAQLVEVSSRVEGAACGLYVCGITPYDATHIGHAATYVAYDGLIRLWLDAGFDVRYVQNSTDVDDPLLERALATGTDWRELAARQTELFRADMEALSVIPPDDYVAVTETIDLAAAGVALLVERGVAYRVGEDIYFDSAAAAASGPWRLGDESRYDRATMLALSAERGGDPDRPGKRDPLDPVLWRGERAGEPSWRTVVGEGRPGWHIECAVIAQHFLDLPMTVHAGGSDLIFPHHEFSAGHTAALTGGLLATTYSHAGLVSSRGEKMSKSVGNLVFVSALTSAGVDPRAIRLAILAQRYQDDWEWTDALLTSAGERLSRWRAWADRADREPARDLVSAPVTPLLAELRIVLAQNLNSPGAIAAIDRRVADGTNPASVDLAAIDALLGIRLG